MKFLLVFLLYGVAGALGSQLNVEVQVPAVVHVGNTVGLHCQFNLHGKKLARVTWQWKGIHLSAEDREFFRYSSSRLTNRGKKQYNPAPGFQVDMANSNANTVIIGDITQEATGTYTCQVEARDRRMKTVKASSFMLVEYKPTFVWNEEATRRLIELYGERKHLFQEITDSEIHEEEEQRLWDDIAIIMEEEYFLVTGPVCANRWKEILNEYNQSQKAENSSGNEEKPFLYTAEMDDIFQKNPEPSQKGVADLLSWLQKEKTDRKDFEDKVMRKLEAMTVKVKEMHNDEMELLNELKRFYF